MTNNDIDNDDNDMQNKNDNEPNNIGNTAEMISGSTTYDVRNEAEEAVQMYRDDQARNHQNEERAGQIVSGDKVMLRVEVQGGGTPLLLPLVKEMVIGRRDPSTQDSPQLDLTPYGAYQMGISRRHAIIRLQDQHVSLTDLGSRNGTYLNGKKLKAHQPTAISDGDEVRLGKIVLKIYLQVDEE